MPTDDLTIAIPRVSPLVRRIRAKDREGVRVAFTSDGRTGTSERIVVQKCRRAGYRCYRLSPATWRALPRFEELVEREVPIAVARAIVVREMTPNTVPSADALRALVDLVPGAIRRRLIERHTGEGADPRRPGVPELLVCRASTRGDASGFLAFVEVKQPTEGLAPHQRAEIEFLRAMGVTAGVLRLVIRRAGTRSLRRTASPPGRW